MIQFKRSFREIEIPAYLYDHCWEGKAVYPAVEALAALAHVVKTDDPQAAVHNMIDAGFPRFLFLPPRTEVLAALVEITEGRAGGIIASLQTKVKSKTGDISRFVKHAQVTFAAATVTGFSAPSLNACSKLTEDGIAVPAALIYQELVPFGAAYHNIVGDLTVSRAGAQARLSGGNQQSANYLLGSPFPFDAVLHAACVWAQRFTAVVPFPIGFARRTIYHKTEKGGTYLARLVPVAFAQEPFVFDAWIYDAAGIVYEAIQGIQMRDVSGGRQRPPSWLQERSS